MPQGTIPYNHEVCSISPGLKRYSRSHGCGLQYMFRVYLQNSFTLMYIRPSVEREQ